MLSTSSKNTSTAGWTSRFLLPLVALAASSASSVGATFTCDTSLGTYYPYCVNVPDGVSSGDKLPTILFLSGSGARGPASNVKSLSGYDGFGKLINQYLSGNKGADQTMAAEKFITIIPISPKNDGGQEVRHWWPDHLDDVLSAVKSKYPVDENAIHCSGYSMGSRGCWRYATNRPGVLASSAPSAGAAESSGDGTLSQQAAPPTFNLLNLITDLPIRQFDGQYDTTAGTESPKKTQEKLQSLGASAASLTELSTDHSGLSTQPFNTDLMQWMLKQTRSGGSSSSSGSSDDSSSDSASSTDSSDSSETTKKVSSKTATVSNPKATQVSSGGSSSSSSSSSKPKCKRSSKKAKRASLAQKSSHKAKRSGLTLAHMLASNQKSQQQQAADKKAKRGLTLEAMLGAKTNSSSSPARRHVEAAPRAHPGFARRVEMSKRASQ